MRPHLLHRYVIKEFLPPFGVGLLVFTFLLILNHLFLMMDLFLNRGVQTGWILKLSALVLPMFLPLSVPMASLLAALLSYGRLSEEGEITALRSSGVTLFQYSWPNLALGVLLSFMLVQFNLNVAPRANQEFKNIQFAVAQQNPLALFAPKVMNHFGEYKIIVDKMDRRKMKLTGISIYKMNPEGAPTRILAPQGVISSHPESSLTIELSNGSIHQPSHDKENQYTITKFNRFALRIPSEIETEAREFTPREMTYRQLQKKIRHHRENRLDPTRWQTEKNMRISISFSPFIFILLGIVLGIGLRKGARAIGIGMSLVVILLYYGLFLLMISLSSQKLFSPLLLTWFPNLIMLSMGGYLWIKRAKQ